MSEHLSSQHFGAEEIQALLEGDLPRGERARFEEHLASCARCSAELAAWRAVFRGLAELPELAPSPGFGDRVLAGVARPERLPLAARVRAALGWPARAAHPREESLQELVDGLLPARQAGRVRAHLESCPACAESAAAWRAAFAQLGRLERLTPTEGFAERVMAGVRVAAPVPAPVPEWRRALAWARGLVPQTRQAWAALSGVAVTPIATLGLVLWTLISHPTLTVDALSSFLWWKMSAMAAVAWQTVASRALESAGLFELYSFFGSLAWSPGAMAGTFVALSLGTVSATWVLYRNLFHPHPANGGLAHVSRS